MQDDLKSFLAALKLDKLSGLFKMSDVSMKSLLNFNEQDLERVSLVLIWLDLDLSRNLKGN